MSPNVTKIYQLKTIGYSDLHTQLQQVSKDFAAIKQAKLDAEKGLANATDTQQAAAYRTELQKIKIATAEIEQQAKQLQADMRAQQLIRQAGINQQKAQVEQQRIAAQQQRAANQQAKADADAAKIASQQQTAAINVQAGSYSSLTKMAKEFYALLKATPQGGSFSFQGQLYSYDEAIAKYNELSAAEQAFRRQFAADKTLVGEYTTGIVQAFKSMGLDDLIGGQVTKANAKLASLATESNVLKEALQTIGSQGAAGIADLNTRLNTMAAASGVLDERFIALQTILQEAGTSGASALRLIEERLIADANEASTLRGQVGAIQTELRGTGDIGSQITASLSNGFKELKGQVAGFVASYFGVQAVIAGTEKLITENAELSDSIANLKIFIHGTTEEANDLVNALKKIDTRTSLAGLVDIATTAAQKGVAKDQIAGVTEAFDKYFSVMSSAGKSEDVHEGVFTIAKLISIFNEDHQVTAQRVNELGNAIFSLKTSGPVSNEFLQGFAERVGAVRSITGATIPEILGFGAAYQQLGQSEEVAGSATSILLEKMIANEDKFASIAGVSVDSFKKIVANNPFEALLTVAEKLKPQGEAGVDQVVKLIGDLGINAVRTRGAFAELINNSELFRAKMAQTGAAIQDTSAEQDAFNEKQNTFAATLDKINKQFELIGSNRAFQVTLSAIAGLIALVLTNLSPLVILLGLYAAGWAVANSEMVIANLQLLYYNTRIILNRTLLGGLTILQNVYALAIGATNVTMRLLVATSDLLGISITGLLGILGAVIGVLVTFASKAQSATDSLKDQNVQLKLQADVLKTATAAIAEQQSEVSEMAAVVKDLSLSEFTRQKALEDLIKVDPSFQKTLVDGKINIQNLNDVLKQYNANLLQKAQLEAAGTRQTQEFQNLVKLENVKRTFELIKSGADVKGYGELTDDEKQFLPGGIGSKRSTNAESSFFNEKLFTGELDNAIANVDKAIAKSSKLNQAAGDYYKTLYAALNPPPAPADAGKPAPTIYERFKELTTKGGTEADFQNLKKDIDDKKAGLDVLSKEYKDLVLLEKQLEDFVNGKVKEAKPDKLSAGDKNDLNSLQAQQDDEIAELKLSYEKKKENHHLTVQEEIDYLQQLQAINDKYNQIKIKAITGNNAAEKAERAKLNLQMIDDAHETNQKIEEVLTKDFTEQAALLKKQYENNVAAINLKVSVTEETPDVSQTAIAEARRNGDREILAVTKDYYAQLEYLAIQDKQKSEGIEEEKQKAITDLIKKSLGDNKAIAEARLKDIEKTYDDAIASVQSKYDNIRNIILDNDGTREQKNIALDQLSRTQQIEEAAAKLHAAEAAYNAAVLQPVFGDSSNAVDDDTAAKLHKRITDAKQELDNAINGIQPKIETLKDLFTNKLAKAFNFDINTTQGKAQYELLAQTITQAFDTASNAENLFFDNEANRIKQSQELQLKRLAIEEQQKKDRSQSQAESDSLDKQYQAKQDAINKEAFEKNKKIQIAQAEINLATQLSNLAVIAFAPNPANILTLGTAGAIMYGIEAVLAVINFGINVAKIKSAQYAYGGGVPKKGGRIGGKPHAEGGTPFTYGTHIGEAEVDELSIIRTRNAPRDKIMQIVGTHSQIASALNVAGGGTSFSPGASIKKFAQGGSISSINPYPYAPVLHTTPNYVINQTDNSDVVENLEEMNQKLDAYTEATNARFDRLEVVQVTSTVTKAQKKEARQSSIGTLGSKKAS